MTSARVGVDVGAARPSARVRAEWTSRPVRLYRDWKWIGMPGDERGDRFRAGVVIHTGAQPIPVGGRRPRRESSARATCVSELVCYRFVSMNVLVRDIPDDVHAALQRRAERRGQSLQQYLAGELRRLAERPSVEDVLDEVDRRRGGQVGFAQAVEDLAAERARS